MSKISKRRKKTANSNIENKAVMASAPAVRREFPYKALLVTVLVLVSIIAAVLLVINLAINITFSVVGYENDDVHFENSLPTAEIKGDMYLAPEKLMEISPAYAAAYADAVANRNSNLVLDVDSNGKVYNYLVVITDEEVGSNSASVVATVVLSFNKQTKQITYININSSVLAVMTNVGVGPMYDAYKFGGVEFLARTIQENYGVKLNGYVDISLASFMDEAKDYGGIKVDGEKYDDIEKAKLAIKNSENKDAALKEAISGLASGAKEDGIFKLIGTFFSVVDQDSAYISDEDVKDLILSVPRMFRKEAKVINIGYKTSNAIQQSGYIFEAYPEVLYTNTCNYKTEVEAFQKAVE